MVSGFGAAYVNGTRVPTGLVVTVAALVLFSGCATRPINPRLVNLERPARHQFEKMETKRGSSENLVILAFSGGGMRAAAFAYGVLETLWRMEVVTNTGRTVRLLDEVDLITGVSGGSFTALAYGLYGEKLFDGYEGRFLKHNVQGGRATFAVLVSNARRTARETERWSEGAFA